MFQSRNPAILWAIPVLFVVGLVSFPAQAKYSGGTGEPNNPYQIATAADLIALGETPEDYHKHFILTADIDLDPNLPGGKVFDKAVIAPDTDPNDTWSDFQGTPFAGVFDGNGHTVSHLTITDGDYLGLFGQLESGAEVRSLGIGDVNITGSGNHIGGLVGSNSGAVGQCFSTGTVRGNSSVGGLVGYNRTTVTQCYSTGTVRGYRYVGGLVGSNLGTVTQCYSTGTVSGSYSVGGLVGDWGRKGTGEVDNGFWDTQTSGQTTSAGGTGKTTAEMQTAKTFKAWGTCGNGGAWTIDEGNDYPRLWWENQPSEVIRFATLSDLLLGAGTESDPFLVYTPEELNIVGLYPCEWDKQFKLMADVDLSAFDGKDGRPVFNIIAPGRLSAYGYFIGTRFTGVFSGNGHRIRYLTVTVKDGGCGGLIAGLGGGAEIKDLGVVDVNITSSGGGVGGLVGVVDMSGWGKALGVVTRCYTTGMVRGGYYVGGLVGINHGNVTQCYSIPAVSGTESVGGLVGANGGIVTGCHGTGAISGECSVGGLVGGNVVWHEDGSWSGEVIDCYSTGAVTGNEDVGGLVGSDDDGFGHFGPVDGCFWDTQTSGQTESGGGTGKTTAEMQTAATFLNAGWDFVGETTIGTADIWWINEGKDYPRLWWEARN